MINRAANRFIRLPVNPEMQLLQWRAEQAHHERDKQWE
jgi:hypothetical protein